MSKECRLCGDTGEVVINYRDGTTEHGPCPHGCQAPKQDDEKAFNDWIEENYRPNIEDPMTTYFEVWQGACAYKDKRIEDLEGIIRRVSRYSFEGIKIHYPEDDSCMWINAMELDIALSEGGADD